MFNNKKDNEHDFCESYKSEILGTEADGKKNSLFSTIVKLLTILVLLGIIVGVSFYGYNYFMNNQKLDTMSFPPLSVQISDDDLVVEAEEDNIEEIANDVKIEIEKSKLEEENKTNIDQEVSEAIKQIEEINNTKKEQSLEVPTSAPEAQYLEELADLSKEIDKERKK